MWPRIATIILALLLPNLGYCLAVKATNCTKIEANKSTCSIELDGEVIEGDSLLIAGVYDIDKLYYEKSKIGYTGYFAGRKFYASYIPRVYSLDAIAGKISPVLTLEVESIFSATPGVNLNDRIQIVSAHTPLRKILSRPIYIALEGLFITLFFIFSFFGYRNDLQDGWSYRFRQYKVFIFSSFAYLVFNAEIFRSFAPWLVQPEIFVYAARVAGLTATWAAASLIIRKVFTDRSCIDYRKQTLTTVKSQAKFLDWFYLTSLFFVQNSTAKVAMVVSLALAVFALYVGLKNFEWRRVWKRSPKISLAFFISIIFVCLSTPIYYLLQKYLPYNSNSWLFSFSIFLAAMRVWSHHRAIDRAHDLVDEIRNTAAHLNNGEKRMQLFCELIESEWQFARVSLIYVQGENGYVIASAGPDAIPEESRNQTRPLGPFLKRVCKRQHLLYAPVAEELGTELQQKGMKHSSLAVPVIQNSAVTAVLCVMADEDERIHPNDAYAIEAIVDFLKLDIISSILQNISEERSQRILALAKANGALMVEKLDSWARVQIPNASVSKIAVSAKIETSHLMEQIAYSPILMKTFEAYQREVRAIWFSLRDEFGFLSKDFHSEEFWAISPDKLIINTDCSLEKQAIGLACLMDRHARSLALSPAYSSLGILGAKIVVAKVDFQKVSVGKRDLFVLEMNRQNIQQIEYIRQASILQEICIALDQEGKFEKELEQLKFKKDSFTIKNGDSATTISVIFPIASDTKEFRKFEINAESKSKQFDLQKKVP